MTSTSLRRFSRDARLKKNLLKNQQQIIVESRLGNTGMVGVFLVIPLRVRAGAEKKTEREKFDVSKYIGAGGRDKYPVSVKQEKEELRKLWMKAAED